MYFQSFSFLLFNNNKLCWRIVLVDITDSDGYAPRRCFSFANKNLSFPALTKKKVFENPPINNLSMLQ